MTNDNDNSLLWILGGTVAVVVVYYFVFYNSEDMGAIGEVTQTIDDAVNSILRGQRLTNAPYDKSSGLVPGNPDDLANSCGLDTETYSLARAISSEEGGSTNGTKVAVGWAINNEANRRGITITQLVTTADGDYGIQTLVHYCSTAQDPYMGDAQIAAGILGGTIADTTNGATNFDRPAGENAAAVQTKRLKAGMTLQSVPTASSGLEFWKNG